MTDDPTGPTPQKSPMAPAQTAREDRLKAALKANMARRKAQARARSAGQAGTEDTSDEDLSRPAAANRTGADGAATEQ